VSTFLKLQTHFSSVSFVSTFVNYIDQCT